MQEVGRAREKRLISGTRQSHASASLVSQVLFQLLNCIHKLIDAQLNHGPFLLEHCHYHFIQYLKEKNTYKLIKYEILLNCSGHFSWLNASDNRCTGTCVSRFRCTLAPYEKCAKIFQLFSNKIGKYQSFEAYVYELLNNRLNTLPTHW